MHVTRRSFLGGTAATVSAVAFPSLALSSTLRLEIPAVAADESDVAAGELVFHITKDVSKVRFANTRGALAYAPWENVRPAGTAYFRPWLFRGEESRTEKRVWAEALLNEGSRDEYTVVVSQAEGWRVAAATPGVERFAPEFVGEPKNSTWLVRHDFSERAHRWTTYHDERGNVFYPCYHHPDGYAWNTQFERGPDKGETPLTSLPFHNYFRWMVPHLNYGNVQGCRFACELAFEGDLKGATAHLFMLIVDSLGGEGVASSGRYHQVAPQYVLNVPADGSFGRTEFVLPDEEGWQARYLRRGSLDNPPPPDLKHVDGFGISFHNLTRNQLPEGVFKMRFFELSYT